MEGKDLVFYSEHDCWYQYEDIQPTGVPYEDAVKRDKEGEVLKEPDTMTIESDGLVGLGGYYTPDTRYGGPICGVPAAFGQSYNKNIDLELVQSIIDNATEQRKKDIEELSGPPIFEIRDISKFSYIRVEAPKICFGNLFIGTDPNSTEGTYLEKHEVQRLITFLQRAESEMR